ncbi:MAG: RNA polymerase-associated protein RapA, partial [Gammaproteobacteria bacterium]|nr:RNA polymerase-associated protein RapA [Gammaproteobacteria bacterium]
DKWFDLRYLTLQQKNKLTNSPVRGLTGTRTSLIPHQLYIAHEVANRFAPRVLLADEVGLGKTIEAGMILHHQLLTERARRVLIVVPETLTHQWLVEMMRRFNLNFSIFNERRCLAMEASNEDEFADTEEETEADTEIQAAAPESENPFHSEQLILVSLDFLAKYPKRQQQALEGEWDLLVVDEAHHLAWSPQSVSHEYQLIEQLAQQTKGVLLLTATPEQLGKASHFARLRLLDPDRFPDLEAFLAEEQSYEPIAQAMEALLGDAPLDEQALQTLQSSLSEGDTPALLALLRDEEVDSEAKTAAKTALVEHLLDRHGTGRVLFRNTRSAVKGFPQREVTLAPLPLPEAYTALLHELSSAQLEEPQLLLTPELLYQAVCTVKDPMWTDFDPRVSWLTDTLKSLRPNKVLVITASADTALDLADALRIKQGIHAAVFHEGLSIIERDRAAAFFADTEFGSQILISSEIGSEGRNFQFAHHLVLFDLPLNPDLLEQRIGRLDRIGQTETIQIHVPYLQDSAQAVMANWYHQGLSAFEQTCPAGHNVFIKVRANLLDTLHHIEDAIEELPNLIATTSQLHNKMNDELHRGRDRLLEFNSCRMEQALELKEQAEAQDKVLGLSEYLDAVYNCFRIDSEIHSEGAEIIRAGEHMPMHIPGLDEDGMTITLNRERALANEDMHFITWEHPFVNNVMDMVLSNEKGNTALTALKYSGVESGTVMLECLYTLETSASSELQSSRYLPPTTLRIVVDEQGCDHHLKLPHKLIQQYQTIVDRKTASKLIQASEPKLRQLLSMGETLANKQAPEILQDAHQQTRVTLEKEINRLKALKQVNPNVRTEEIEFFQTQWAALNKVVDAAVMRLEAVRVIVVM